MFYKNVPRIYHFTGFMDPVPQEITNSKRFQIFDLDVSSRCTCDPVPTPTYL